MSATGTSNCAACHDCHRCHPHSASCLSILRRTIAFNEVKLKMRRNVRPAPFLLINVAWTWADRIVARYRSCDRFIEIARLNEGRRREEEEVLKSSGALWQRRCCESRWIERETNKRLDGTIKSGAERERKRERSNGDETWRKIERGRTRERTKDSFGWFLPSLRVSLRVISRNLVFYL